MTYRLWCGRAESEADYNAQKSQWITIVRKSLHDAPWSAMRCNDKGSQVAWEIEGDDGTKLDRNQIAEAVEQRRSELIANPPRTY